MSNWQDLFTDKNTATELRLPFWLRLLRQIPLPRKLGLLGRIYGNQLEQLGIGWVRTSIGPVWKLDLRNSTHRWIVMGDYEGPGFVGWARRWLRKDSVVVDSGANIGQVLIYLAPKIKSGKYLAFEPFPPAREWLLKCLERYPEWPVQVEEFGLGEREGTASLEGQWGGEAAVGSHTELKVGKGDIQITTMDKYAGENNIKKIRLWKLDMEGGEEAALKGARELLERQAIDALVLETDSNRFGGVTKMLGCFGYFPSNWSGKKMKTERVPSYGNVLFLPSKNS